MVDVILIDPPFPERPWDINWLTRFPPKGLLYLAAALKNANIGVEVIDAKIMQFEQPSLLRRSIKEICRVTSGIVEAKQPKIVGITSSTLSYRPAVEVIKAVKDKNPQVTTIVGGVHVSFTAEETLKESPFIDIVVRGEGERTIVEIAEGRKPEEIEGISFRDKNGVVIHNQARKVMEPQDIPIPAYDCVNMKNYSYVVFQCVRGCPHSCSFCEIPELAGAKIRHRLPKHILSECELAFSLNPNLEIRLEDEFLGVDMPRARKILTGLVKRSLKPFRTAIRPEGISDELLQLLKKVGCSNLYVGMESGSDSVLKYNGRGFNLADLRKFLDICRRNEMLFHAGFIFGLPGETKQTLEETLKFAMECADITFPIVKNNFPKLLQQMPFALIIENSRPEFNLLAPNPGTPMGQNPKKFGYKIFHKDWELYDCNTPVGEPEGVKADYLVEFKNRAFMLTKKKMVEYGLPVGWWDSGYKG